MDIERSNCARASKTTMKLENTTLLGTVYAAQHSVTVPMTKPTPMLQMTYQTHGQHHVTATAKLVQLIPVRTCVGIGFVNPLQDIIHAGKRGIIDADTCHPATMRFPYHLHRGETATTNEFGVVVIAARVFCA